MAENDFPFQPGVILHEAIVGAFRASGGTFAGWCAAQKLTQPNVRQCTFGQTRGPASTAILKRLIEDAGPDVVKAGYLARLKSHVAEVKGAA